MYRHVYSLEFLLLLLFFFHLECHLTKEKTSPLHLLDNIKIKKITMGKDDLFSSTIDSIISNLLSPHCYNEFILKQHFFDLGCNKMLLSKILGYAILVGSLLVKFPQIVKIKWNKSGVGVSVLAETIMLAAIFGSMAYGYTSEFPLSAYGDSYCLFIQTILVILLVLYYQRKYLAAVAYLGLFKTLTPYLLLFV